MRSDLNDDWSTWRSQWELRSDTIYLNHGSFGPPPTPVVNARQRWQRALDEQPMDFFVRQYEPAWRSARDRLARFVNTPANNLVFVENATAGMNVVADSVVGSLSVGDQVLLTDHEYGAVRRIWERVAATRGATVSTVELPRPMETAEQVVDTILAAITERTRMLVVSHITSPTAVILPVRRICDAARSRGVSVCIDGPHAPLQTDVDLTQLGCDYYTASCHKWLSAPFGSGFLFVSPARHESVRTPQLSWGRLAPATPTTWDDEFLWVGTRDPSPYFSIPAAIDFFAALPLEQLRARMHFLARYARQRLTELFRLAPLVPDSDEWYGSMAHVPLPPGDAKSLQDKLWRQFGIEVPIVAWQGGRYVRVSCHVYNTTAEIDRLVEALRELAG